MSNYFLNLAKKISKRLFSTLRLNLRPIKNYRNYFLFRRQRKEWIRKGGTITNNYMILRDYDDYAGNAKGHYFHQDLLVASMIQKATPKRH